MSIPNLSEKELSALRFLRNEILHGKKSPSVRDLKEYLGYGSPRSAMIIIDKLIEAGFLERDSSQKLRLLRDPENIGKAQTIDVPIVGSAPCGSPLLSEENIDGTVAISTLIAKPPYKYFLLRADGDSMNRKGINDGDLVLVKQQLTAEENDAVVALIDNEATIKEFHQTPNAIILKPESDNKEHKPIVVTSDFQIQGKVIQTLPKLSSYL